MFSRETANAMVKSGLVHEHLRFLKLTDCPDETLWGTIAGNPKCEDPRCASRLKHIGFSDDDTGRFQLDAAVEPDPKRTSPECYPNTPSSAVAAEWLLGSGAGSDSKRALLAELLLHFALSSVGLLSEGTMWG